MEGGLQPNLEKGLEIGGFGYPALTAVNAKKKKYSLFRLGFTEKAIGDFINQLVVGRAPTSAFTEVPVVTTTPWDGKDHVAAVEEEFDLSDLEDVEDSGNTRRKTEL